MKIVCYAMKIVGIVMNRVIIIIYFNFLFTITPYSSSFFPNENFEFNSSEVGFLPSNSIIDIRLANNRLVFGTSGGLGYMDISDDNLFGTFEDDNLPYGSNPSVISKNSIIAVSGGQMVEAAGGIYPSGTGIGYSIDNGMNWAYKYQPIDPIPNDGLYQTISWGNQDLKQLSVTTEINNITYDLAIIGDYIYSTSWAGGLRRFKFQNFDIVEPGEEVNPWQIIPLPMDNQYTLDCGYIDIDSYELNPNDPINGGSHNHKGFSVYTNNDSTIWVGTAAGINKGIINYETDCIDWEHYDAITHGFSGNWVIGFNHQTMEDGERIWAITWSTGGSEKNAISYSDDNGLTWNVPEQINQLNLKFYNIFSKENYIYASSEDGLFVSNNGDYWSKISHIEGIDGQKVLSETVYSSINITNNNMLWLGTQDGLAYTSNLGLDWEVVRFWSNTDKDDFYAYPNPFYINEINQFNNQGYVRLVFKNASENSKVEIFNFSMEKVIELDNITLINNNLYQNIGEIIWDGRNSYGHKVSNGVYFCRLKNQKNISWSKLMVIN
tara:strand:+ start:6340 stop:7989 length:1650 start_codon:yes stop_codon:yes gene_type:complete